MLIILVSSADRCHLKVLKKVLKVHYAYIGFNNNLKKALLDAEGVRISEVSLYQSCNNI